MTVKIPEPTFRGKILKLLEKKQGIILSVDHYKKFGPLCIYKI